MTSTDDTFDAMARPVAATEPDPAQAADRSGLSYGKALEELESLLAELEEADVDVDRLTQQVARGVELVRFCRQRLAEVTADVDQVVADLMAVPETEELEESPTEDDDGGHD